MKIKNLFFILMIGICVIPLLSVGIMTLMIYYRSVSRFLVQNVATGDADVRAADGSEIPEELEYSIRLYVDQLIEFSVSFVYSGTKEGKHSFELAVTPVYTLMPEYKNFFQLLGLRAGCMYKI